MNSFKKFPFNLLCDHLTSLTFSSCKRVPKASIFNTTKRFKSTYDGDGKTSAAILNIEEKLGLMIVSYSPHGFRLNNRLFVKGSMAIFPNTVLSWQVSKIDDVTEESLSIFPVVEPNIDIVVIGVGDAENCNRESIVRIRKIMKKFNLPVEILPTDSACTTFNFLVAENRFVGAALLPKLKGYDPTRDGMDRLPDKFDIFH